MGSKWLHVNVVRMNEYTEYSLCLHIYQRYMCMCEYMHYTAAKVDSQHSLK